MTDGFKNDIRNLVNFLHKKLKTFFDESSVYNVLAEGINFLDQSKLIEFQLFGLSIACLKLFKLFMYILRPGVSFV